MREKVLILAIMIICLLSQACEDVSGEEDIRFERKSAGPVIKAERGLNNIMLGWTEIPKRVIMNTGGDYPVPGFFTGIFQGAFEALGRTTSGAADLVTFPIGKYDRAVVSPEILTGKTKAQSGQ